MAIRADPGAERTVTVPSGTGTLREDGHVTAVWDFNIELD
jgi:hypothetical protein